MSLGDVAIDRHTFVDENGRGCPISVRLDRSPSKLNFHLPINIDSAVCSCLHKKHIKIQKSELACFNFFFFLGVWITNIMIHKPMRDVCQTTYPHPHTLPGKR